LLTLTCCDGGFAEFHCNHKDGNGLFFMAVRLYLGREIKLHSDKEEDFSALMSISNYKFKYLSKK